MPNIQTNTSLRMNKVSARRKHWGFFVDCVNLHDLVKLGILRSGFADEEELEVVRQKEMRVIRPHSIYWHILTQIDDPRAMPSCMHSSSLEKLGEMKLSQSYPYRKILWIKPRTWNSLMPKQMEKWQWLVEHHCKHHQERNEHCLTSRWNFLPTQVGLGIFHHHEISFWPR